MASPLAKAWTSHIAFGSVLPGYKVADLRVEAGDNMATVQASVTMPSLSRIYSCGFFRVRRAIEKFRFGDDYVDGFLNSLPKLP